MDAAEALAFARKNPQAVLATMKRDGTPQLSPVLVGVDSRDRLVVSTRESAMKTLNLRRGSRAWLCVLNDRFFGGWAQLSGDVEVVSLPEATEPLSSTTAPSPGSIRTGTTIAPPWSNSAGAWSGSRRGKPVRPSSADNFVDWAGKGRLPLRRNRFATFVARIACRSRSSCAEK